MKHNKHEIRGEDHGTLDTKRTAKNIVEEKYSNLLPHEALPLAIKDLEAETLENDKMRKKLERYEDGVGKENIEYGMNEQFAASQERPAIPIRVEVVEGDAKNIEVFKIPAQKLGEIALTDK